MGVRAAGPVGRRGGRGVDKSNATAPSWRTPAGAGSAKWPELLVTASPETGTRPALVQVMPEKLLTDPSLPALARRSPLAAALLSSWAHAGSALGDYAAADAARMDAARGALGLARAVEGGAA